MGWLERKEGEERELRGRWYDSERQEEETSGGDKRRPCYTFGWLQVSQHPPCCHSRVLHVSLFLYTRVSQLGPLKRRRLHERFYCFYSGRLVFFFSGEKLGVLYVPVGITPFRSRPALRSPSFYRWWYTLEMDTLPSYTVCTACGSCLDERCSLS